MGCVKANTPKDAVFAHWWDYGYWVQTGGERATITDGGNAIGYWNYLMGRNVLTGHNDMDALEFLYAHNASYLLMISDEIGKYPAFSSIGSDANYDRYAWINVFSLDESNIRETRNSTIYPYRGGFSLTDDIVYNGKLYPKQAAGIAAVMVPLNIDSEKVTVEQPQALVIYNNQQQTIPVKCIFLDGNEIVFDGEGINGCFMIIPAINGNAANKVGSAMFLGERVWKSRFAQLYLLGKQNEHFAVVYNDEKSLPLSVYNGRLIGPLKIWKINYPEGIESKEIYEQTSFPDDSVTRI